MGAVATTGNVKVVEKDEDGCDPKPPSPDPDEPCCEKSYTVVIHFH